jgi:hypothetical protein
LVVGLDVKTMAEQWKGYARLAFQYVEHLKPRLDVAGPLQFLATHISHNLRTVVEMVGSTMYLLSLWYWKSIVFICCCQKY